MPPAEVPRYINFFIVRLSSGDMTAASRSLYILEAKVANDDMFTDSWMASSLNSGSNSNAPIALLPI